jgi:inosose dehydratase
MTSASRVNVGVTPNTWWDDFPILPIHQPTPEEMLRQMKKAGFAGTETGPNLPTTAAALQPLLDAAGMALVGGFFDSYLLERSFEEEEQRFRAFLGVLSALNAKFVTGAEMSFTPDAVATRMFPYSLPFLTTAQWTTLGDGWRHFAAMARDHGLTVAYHAHLGTVVQYEWQLQRLLENVPDLTLCLDTGHLAVAGADPLAVLKKYLGNIVYWHLKNVRPDVAARVRVEPIPWTWAKIQGLWTVPGDGGIDFAPICQTIADSGYSGWVMIEAEGNSLTSDPFLYGSLGRQYLHTVAGW